MNLLLSILQLTPWLLFPGSVTPAQETVKPATDIREKVSVCLLLPFNTGEKTNTSMLNFYSGALLALKDSGQKGQSAEITAVDILEEDGDGTLDSLLLHSDLIIGPVSREDIRDISLKCPEDKWIVSPLEPRVHDLCDSINLIQVPTMRENQYSTLVNWLASETGTDDNVIIITRGREDADLILQTEKILDSRNISHVSVDIGSEDYLRLNDTEHTIDRFITASRNLEVLSESVRKVSILAAAKPGIALYCPSEVRGLPDVKEEMMHGCNIRIAANYIVDHSDPKVRAFEKDYRDAFLSDPNMFAFHGYDTMKYFLTLHRRYGHNWRDGITELHYRGFQSDFRFEKTGNGSYINTATRKYTCNRDFSITIVY